MKRAVTIVCMVILLAGVLLAQTETNSNQETVTVPKSMLTQAQLAELEKKDVKTNVHEWVGVGKEVGEAINSSLAAVTTQTNNFAQTGVGKVTMALVVWRVVGADMVHLIIGFAIVVVALPIWLWSYRRMCMVRQVMTKETIQPDKTRIREWRTVTGDDDNRSSMNDWRIAHWFAIAVVLGIVLTTSFSF